MMTFVDLKQKQMTTESESNPKPVDVLLLISELEGSYQHTKKWGWDEDRDVLREMCNRYYKLYFKLKKETKQ